MSDESSIDRNKNLWAPWRMEYIDTLHDKADHGCFLCKHCDDAADDAKNFIIWRGERCFAMLNRFPYNSGHTMVAPYEHVGEFGLVDEAAMAEMVGLLRNLEKLLNRVVRPEGFNIGLNLGRCAGAGLPGHLHWHIVPRWSGDTNFMPVFGKVRVIPQALDTLYAELKKAWAALGLPRPAGGKA